MVKYKWYKPQLAVMGVIHWRVLTWRERGKKQWFQNTSLQLKLTQSNKELAQSLFIFWSCEDLKVLIHYHNKQNTASLILVSFFIVVKWQYFFQMCNVNLAATYSQPSDPTKSRAVQNMVVWVVTPCRLASVTNLYLILQPRRQRQQVLLEYSYQPASLHSATTKTTIWTIPNMKSGNIKLK